MNIDYLSQMIGLLRAYVRNLEDLKAIKKIKQKHKWSGQLLTFFLEETFSTRDRMIFTTKCKDFDSFFISKEQLPSMFN